MRVAGETISVLRASLAEARGQPQEQAKAEEKPKPGKEQDKVCAALQAKRDEAADQLAKATIGSRTEKVLREALLQYQRLITDRLREQDKKTPVKQETPPPAKRTNSKKRDVFSQLF